MVYSELEYRSIEELQSRSGCLVPPADSEAAITCHEHDYCRCDIEVLLKEIARLKKEKLVFTPEDFPITLNISSMTGIMRYRDKK